MLYFRRREITSGEATQRDASLPATAPGASGWKVLGVTESQEKCLAMTIGMTSSVFLIAFIVIMIIVAPRFSDTGDTKPKVCDSRACLKYAYYLQSSLNVKVDPCSDFYGYVCGSWKPPIENQKSVGQTLFERVMSGVRSKVENHPAASRNRGTRKAADMYDACTSAQLDTNSNVATLKAFMRDINLSWPSEPDHNVHPFDVLINLAAKWRTEFIFNLALHSSNGTLIVLLYPGALLNEWVSMKVPAEQFPEYVEKHAAMFGLSVLNGPMVSHMMDVQREVTQSAAALKEPLGGRPPRAFFPLKSVRNHSKAGVNASTWLSFLNKHLHRGDNRKEVIHENDIFFVTDVRLLEVIDRTLLITPARLLSYIGWKFVERFGVILSRSIADIFYKAPGRSVPVYCCTFVEATYGFALTANYTMTLFTDKDRTEIDRFLDKVTVGTTELLLGSGWTDETIAVAKTKLAGMGRSIWVRGKTGHLSTLDRFYNSFPSIIENFTENWIESTKALWRKSNTHEYIQYDVSSNPSRFEYRHYTNAAKIPMTLTFQPMYDKGYTDAINYAGLGSVFAETIAHAFDYSGIMFDSGGRLRSWMSDKSFARYKLKLECYKDAENTARMWASVGLEGAYKAFQDAQKQQKGTRLLVNFTDYSSTRLFFVAYCFVGCSVSGWDFYSVRNRDACNYALQQSKHFAEAFKCGTGTKMNPQNKCSFWE